MKNFDLRNNEKKIILRCLEYHQGHRNDTCESLGISIRCLRNKLIRWKMSNYLKFEYKHSIDKEMIIETLKLNNGHRGKTAKALGMSRKFLRNKLIKFGLADYLKYQHKNPEISKEREGYLKNLSKRTSKEKKESRK